MQFTTITTIAALALGSAAAVLPRQAALAQFRTFSGTDCFTGNNGFTQIYAEDLDVCHPFENSIEVVYSVTLEQIANGCSGKLLSPPPSPFDLIPFIHFAWPFGTGIN